MLVTEQNVGILVLNNMQSTSPGPQWRGVCGMRCFSSSSLAFLPTLCKSVMCLTLVERERIKITRLWLVKSKFELTKENYPYKRVNLILPNLDCLPSHFNPDNLRENHRHKEQILQKGSSLHAPLEKRMVTHSSILAWRIPWIEEPWGSQRVKTQLND